MNKDGPQEGSECPECNAGEMEFPSVEGCYCHLSAPCNHCTENKLTCNACGWEFIPPPPQTSWRACGPISEQYTKNPVRELGNGKRIYDFDYDSSSGSTMVYRGKYAGPVTAQDIIETFGDGTFGHRGPSMHGGSFTYTKITD